MRIRQVKPEFFKDGTIADLSIPTRLTYIGLWLLADDAGWFRLDEPAIGLELFGWDPRGRREHIVRNAIAALKSSGRIVPHPCGHGFIPRFVSHQRFSAETKRVYTIKREHEACPREPAAPPQVPAGDDEGADLSTNEANPAGARGSPRFPATEQGTGNGTVRKGKGNVERARKRDDESESEFRLRVKPEFMGGDGAQ